MFSFTAEFYLKSSKGDLRNELDFQYFKKDLKKN